MLTHDELLKIVVFRLGPTLAFFVICAAASMATACKGCADDNGKGLSHKHVAGVTATSKNSAVDAVLGGASVGGKSGDDTVDSGKPERATRSEARRDASAVLCNKVNCDDSNVCTDDICVDQKCQHTNNTAACMDDGIDCTDDICAAGACIHQLVNPIAISAGTDHTCALMDNSGVRCWGRNQHGQIGDSTIVDRESPSGIYALMGVQALAAGGMHTCALMRSGGVRCWGDNSLGQLGNGTRAPRATPPSYDVLSIANLKQVVTGEEHTCVLTSSGGVRCWGKNAHGALGNGNLFNKPMPSNSDVGSYAGDGDHGR